MEDEKDFIRLMDEAYKIQQEESAKQRTLLVDIWGEEFQQEMEKNIFSLFDRLVFIGIFKNIKEQNNIICINNHYLEKQQIDYEDNMFDNENKIISKNLGKYEWVYQESYGDTGDSWQGYVAWKYKNQYLLFDFEC